MHCRLPTRLRASLDVLIAAALVASGVMLAASGWYAFASVRAYLDSSARIERLRHAERLLPSVRLSAYTGVHDNRATSLGRHQDAADSHLPVPDDIRRPLAEARRLLEENPVPVADFPHPGAETRQRLDALRHADPLPVPERPDASDPASPGGDGTGFMPRIAADAAQLHRTVTTEIDAESSRATALEAQAARSASSLALLVVLVIIAGAALLVWEERERRRLRRQLDDGTCQDPLTGLPDHRFFDVWLGYALAQARRDDTHLGLLCIGLDGLPSVDALRGRKERRRALAEIARRFRATARDADVLVRQGSDGFVLAVPGIRDAREIDALAQRLIASLRDPERPPIFDLPIGASIGVAFYPHDAGDVAGVLAAAADAMYVARRSGRNRAVLSAVAAFA